MDATITAGTKFYIGTQKAATLVTDYDGDTWTEVKGIKDLGEVADEAEAIKVLTIGDARQRTYKGARNGGELDVVCISDPSDAGQTAMKAAYKSVSQVPFNFKVVFPDVPVSGSPVHGTELYFSGVVMSASRKIAGANDVLEMTYKTTINTDVLEVAAA